MHAISANDLHLIAEGSEGEGSEDEDSEGEETHKKRKRGKFSL